MISHRGARLFAFLIFFSIDVRVHAAMLATLKAPVQEPQSCFRRTEICALATYEGTKYKFVTASMSLTMGSNALITRLDRDRYELVRGDLWVRTEDTINIVTEFGDIIVNHGDVLISRQAKQVTVKNLMGSVRLAPKGGSEIEIEKGFENSLEPVGSKGVAMTGIPQLMDLKQVIKLLGKLYDGERHDFNKLAHRWMNEWPDLVEKAADFHLNLMKRSIASQEAKESADQLRQLLIRTERQRLLKIYRQKTFDH